MEAIVQHTLGLLQFRDVQRFENMTLLPILADLDGGPAYITLAEALEKKLLKVTEVSTLGQVPKLKATSTADVPILMLDGEELAGAKQNRVLNTTILLKERVTCAIPVSCTEQGRWTYTSPIFEDAGLVMERRARTAKMSSVAMFLRQSGEFKSDQHEVWGNVCNILFQSGTPSRTGAQRDAFCSKEKQLSDYLAAFPVVEGQKGSLFFVDGRLVGFDYLSSADAYSKVHDRLAKSYCMEALLSRNKNLDMPNLADAKQFIESATAADEKIYDSVSLGKDHRFHGESLVGSALVYEDCVIHMAFFATEDNALAPGSMTSSQRRMGFRMVSFT